MKKYDRLIFVSNSDTCRGPMAEAILKSKFLLSELEVESRGLVVLLSLIHIFAETGAIPLKHFR